MSALVQLMYSLSLSLHHIVNSYVRRFQFILPMVETCNYVETFRMVQYSECVQNFVYFIRIVVCHSRNITINNIPFNFDSTLKQHLCYFWGWHEVEMKCFEPQMVIEWHTHTKHEQSSKNLTNGFHIRLNLYREWGKFINNECVNGMRCFGSVHDSVQH